jgi:hypothetical protein
MAHSPGAREGQFVERQEPHHVGASDRVPTQEVRLTVAVEVCNGRAGRPCHPRRPAHVPDGIRTVTGLRHTRSDWTSPFMSDRHGAPAARSAHGSVTIDEPGRRVEFVALPWRPSSVLEPQARPTRHMVRMTSRKGVAAGLGAKHGGRAKHRDRAMCEAYRSWRGGRMVDGRANTAGYSGSRLSTNS